MNLLKWLMPRKELPTVPARRAPETPAPNHDVPAYGLMTGQYSRKWLRLQSDDYLVIKLEGHAEKRGFMDIMGGHYFKAVDDELRSRGIAHDVSHIERNYFS